MSFLSVDKHKCKGDGVCVAACPINILEMDTKNRIPSMIKKGDRICIRCGHCVSICPHGALSIEPMHARDCQPLRPDWRVPSEKMSQFLKGRRSIRLYKDQPVDRHTLEKLIDVARFAPSGVNRQPLSWVVIHDKARVRHFSELVINWMRILTEADFPLARSFHMKRIVHAWDKNHDWICRGAPNLVISYGLKDDISAPQAAAIALTYFELAATSFGVGTCWAGYGQVAINMSPEVHKFVGLTHRTSCFGAMMAGYPRVNYHRIPLRKKANIIWR